MKILLFAAAFTCSLPLFSQPNLTGNKVVIVSCKSGDLYIDGTLVGKIDADDAKSQTLSIGEHYLQVKTATEKFNITAKIEANTNDIIKIGCDANAPAPTALQSQDASPTILVDKQLNLSGTITNGLQQNIFALDAGDNIILTCAVLNKKGSASISIREYFTNTEIFRNEGFNAIDRQKITVPSKGIYIFNVTTKAFFGKDIRLSVARIPSPSSSANFKTGVKRYYDTSTIELLKTDAFVHSINNAAGNRSTFMISLPKGTTYWVYWIGVGQEANQKMKSTISQFANLAAKLPANPVVWFGLKLIPSLPMFNGTANVSYRFLDEQNATLFERGAPYQFLNIKYSDGISADYSRVDVCPANIVLGVWNNGQFLGQNVTINVVAFVVKPMLAFDE